MPNDTEKRTTSGKTPPPPPSRQDSTTTTTSMETRDSGIPPSTRSAQGPPTRGASAQVLRRPGTTPPQARMPGPTATKPNFSEYRDPKPHYRTDSSSTSSSGLTMDKTPSESPTVAQTATTRPSTQQHTSSADDDSITTSGDSAFTRDARPTTPAPSNNQTKAQIPEIIRQPDHGRARHTSDMAVTTDTKPPANTDVRPKVRDYDYQQHYYQTHPQAHRERSQTPSLHQTSEWIKPDYSHHVEDNQRTHPPSRTEQNDELLDMIQDLTIQDDHISLTTHPGETSIPPPRRKRTTRIYDLEEQDSDIPLSWDYSEYPSFRDRPPRASTPARRPRSTDPTSRSKSRERGRSRSTHKTQSWTHQPNTSPDMEDLKLRYTDLLHRAQEMEMAYLQPSGDKTHAQRIHRERLRDHVDTLKEKAEIARLKLDKAKRLRDQQSGTIHIPDNQDIRSRWLTPRDIRAVLGDNNNQDPNDVIRKVLHFAQSLHWHNETTKLALSLSLNGAAQQSWCYLERNLPFQEAVHKLCQQFVKRETLANHLHEMNTFKRHQGESLRSAMARYDIILQRTSVLHDDSHKEGVRIKGLEDMLKRIAGPTIAGQIELKRSSRAAKGKDFPYDQQLELAETLDKLTAQANPTAIAVHNVTMHSRSSSPFSAKGRSKSPYDRQPASHITERRRSEHRADKDRARSSSREKQLNARREVQFAQNISEYAQQVPLPDEPKAAHSQHPPPQRSAPTQTYHHSPPEPTRSHRPRSQSTGNWITTNHDNPSEGLVATSAPVFQYLHFYDKNPLFQLVAPPPRNQQQNGRYNAYSYRNRSPWPSDNYGNPQRYRSTSNGRNSHNRDYTNYDRHQYRQDSRGRRDDRYRNDDRYDTRYDRQRSSSRGRYDDRNYRPQSRGREQHRSKHRDYSNQRRTGYSSRDRHHDSQSYSHGHNQQQQRSRSSDSIRSQSHNDSHGANYQNQQNQGNP